MLQKVYILKEFLRLEKSHGYFERILTVLLKSLKNTRIF